MSLDKHTVDMAHRALGLEDGEDLPGPLVDLLVQVRACGARLGLTGPVSPAQVAAMCALWVWSKKHGAQAHPEDDDDDDMRLHQQQLRDYLDYPLRHRKPSDRRRAAGRRRRPANKRRVRALVWWRDPEEMGRPVVVRLPGGGSIEGRFISVVRKENRKTKMARVAIPDDPEDYREFPLTRVEPLEREVNA